MLGYPPSAHQRSWFENCAISTVPASRRGHGPRVYPGSTELIMLSTYLFRHCASGGELLAKFFHDDGSDAAGHPFSKLFFSIEDVPAEILRPLLWFGLLEHRSERISGHRFGELHFYRKAVLFDRMLTFNVAVDLVAGARH